MRRALVIYNPAAGRFSVRPFISGAVQELESAGWKAEAVKTQSGAHAVELAKQAVSEKMDAAFAVGGDGTIGQVASGLLDSDTALGILPAGTANVLAVELGLPIFSWTNWWALRQNAATLAREAPTCAVDIVRCNGQPFLLWAGMGLDAMTIHAIEPRLRVEKFFAFPEYFGTTVWNASQWNGVRLRLWADDQEVEGNFLVAVANNIRRYMGGLAILSPDAHMDDGQFDIWLLSGHSLVDVFRHAYDLWRGRHLDSDSARRIPFNNLRVEADTPFLVQTDGEPRPATREVTIGIHPRALKLLMPVKSLHLLANQPTLTKV